MIVLINMESVNFEVYMGLNFLLLYIYRNSFSSPYAVLWPQDGRIDGWDVGREGDWIDWRGRSVGESRVAPGLFHILALRLRPPQSALFVCSM